MLASVVSIKDQRTYESLIVKVNMDGRRKEPFSHEVTVFPFYYKAERVESGKWKNSWQLVAVVVVHLGILHMFVF